VAIRSKIIKISPVNPAREAIMKAATIIKSGGTIVFPTRCLYGLGTDAFNAAAVDRLFSIKRRSTQKPILILIDHIRQLERLVTHIPEIAVNIMQKFWPGNITLVFEAGDDVCPNLTGRGRQIGIRLPGHPVASALVKAVASPITGTSANLSGSPGCHQVSDLQPEVGAQVELIIDAGPLEGGRGSTVIDVTKGDKPIILREGIISKGDILTLDH